MELLKLRKRAALASRGHRLLSEKRDEISRQLIQIARHIQPLRRRVETELLETCRRFMLARATMEPEDTKAALEVPTKKFSLAIEFANIMNVKVPHLIKDISGEIICYGYATTSGEMDVALLALERAFDHLIELADQPLNENHRHHQSVKRDSWRPPCHFDRSPDGIPHTLSFPAKSNGVDMTEITLSFLRRQVNVSY
jgi:hypothetical protein